MTERGALREYFEDADAAKAFMGAFARLLAKHQNEVNAKYVNPDNVHRFHHGERWSHPADPDVADSETRTHSVEYVTKFEDIVNHNLGLLDQSLRAIGESMHRQFTAMVFSTVADSCDATGNVVSAKEAGSVTAAFVAMLEKMEFHADKDGNVSLPQIHAGADAHRNLTEALNSAPPEVRSEIEALTQLKTERAIERERERKEKFLGYGAA